MCFQTQRHMFLFSASSSTGFDVTPNSRFAAMNDDILITLTVPTHIKCAGACLRKPQCFSYNYHQQDNLCQLLTLEDPTVEQQTGWLMGKINQDHTPVPTSAPATPAPPTPPAAFIMH